MTDDSLLNDITPALEVHLREYEMLRNQYNQDSSMQHQLTNYAIAITAGAGSLFFIGEPSLAIVQQFFCKMVWLSSETDIGLWKCGHRFALAHRSTNPTTTNTTVLLHLQMTNKLCQFARFR